MSMADRDGWIWYDGKLVPWRDASTHVLTHTLHYGMGVFEGVRCYATDAGPAIFRLADHTERLFNSAKIFGMKIPYAADELNDAQKACVRENKLDSCYIRPIAFYGSNAMGVAARSNPVRVAIAAWPWGAYLGAEGLEKGIRVRTETCPHYLVNGSERYEEAEGIKYYTTPPLRPSWHQEILWKGVVSGDIHVVASDHAAFNHAGQKDVGKENFSAAPRGFPGIQERIALLHAAGVSSGKITINHMVELVSTAPARLFGLFPRKGSLAIGSDADMIIFDPKAELTLSKSIGLSRADFCPYEGMKVRGAPWLVLLRGRVIAREGKVMGRPGSGEYLPRLRSA